jgi:hypothetical protein
MSLDKTVPHTYIVGMETIKVVGAAIVGAIILAAVWVAMLGFTLLVRGLTGGAM